MDRVLANFAETLASPPGVSCPGIAEGPHRLRPAGTLDGPRPVPERLHGKAWRVTRRPATIHPVFEAPPRSSILKSPVVVLKSPFSAVPGSPTPGELAVADGSARKYRIGSWSSWGIMLISRSLLLGRGEWSPQPRQSQRSNPSQAPPGWVRHCKGLAAAEPRRCVRHARDSSKQRASLPERTLVVREGRLFFNKPRQGSEGRGTGQSRLRPPIRNFSPVSGRFSSQQRNRALRPGNRSAGVTLSAVQETSDPPKVMKRRLIGLTRADWTAGFKRPTTAGTH